MTRRYVYLGDHYTDRALVGAQCEAVLRADGKCIVGKLGTMLVLFHGEQRPRVVIRRRLRKAGV
ncbi:MAG: hypothetical protein JWM41_2855 [Gemmatimonadetes bacterium]|nr:hypothetical protein [Gemmatimonadota bacterium]